MSSFLPYSEVTKMRGKGYSYARIASTYGCNKSIVWKCYKWQVDMSLGNKKRYIERDVFPIWQYCNPYEIVDIAVKEKQPYTEIGLDKHCRDVMLDKMFFFNWKNLGDVENPSGWLLKAIRKEIEYYIKKYPKKN